MRWILCLGEHLANLPIKQHIFEELSKAPTDGSIVISDFNLIKVIEVRDFLKYSELLFDFLRDKPNWAFAVNERQNHISFEKHQNQVTFITDFFSDNLSEQWHDELVLTESIKSATSEFDLLNAYNKAQVQAFGVKGDWFAYCRKTGKAFSYARYNKFTHVMTDEDSLIVRPEFKRIWADTKPTVIDLQNYTIIRETT